MVSATKNPVKVRAGTIGARARWGEEPRVVRLDDLSAPQRRLVMALIDAAKKEASTAVEEPVEAYLEVRRGSVETQAA